MTISTLTNRADYTGDDTTVTFAYPFKIFSEDDLRVVVKNQADGVETVLTLNTHYTVANEGASSGTITLIGTGGAHQASGVSGLKSTYDMVVRRVANLTQETDIRNQGAFYPEIHENQFDKLVLNDQAQQDEIDRSFKLPDTIDPDDFDTRIPIIEVGATIAGKYLLVNDAGDGLEIGPPYELPDAVADGATKGVATFTAAEFNSASGVISLDYTNAQAASAVNKGFLTSADWTTFNNKQPAGSYQASGNYITALTGDVTASGPGSASATLANSGVSAGSFVNASITVDAKGRITSAATGSITGSPITTKGDLHTFSTVDARLPVGADGEVLVADSAEATGLKWAGAATGDVVGPASSTDNAVARFDLATGKLLQSTTNAILSDAGQLRLGTTNTTEGTKLKVYDQSATSNGFSVGVEASGSDATGTATSLGGIIVSAATTRASATGQVSATGIRGDASIGGAQNNTGSSECIGVKGVGSSSGVGTVTGSGAFIAGGYFQGDGSSGAATVTHAHGVRAIGTNSGPGTVTNAYGISVRDSADGKTGGGVITNSYGAYINRQTGGGTLNYSLYVNGGQSFMDGTADEVQLNIQGHSTQTANILNVEKSDGTDLLSVTNTSGTNIRGTTTNDAASTGFVGEQIESLNATGTTSNSNQYKDITSITLTAGDWDLQAGAIIALSGATSFSNLIIGIGTVTGNDATGLVLSYNALNLPAPTASDDVGGSIPSHRVSIASSTTYYLKVKATYLTSDIDYRGSIWARRVR